MMQLPEAFITRTRQLIGDEWPAFEHALNEDCPTSARLNPRKMGDTPCETGDLIFEEPVSWASNAYYLSSRPSFTLDPLFHAGCYYVQEASSMFLEQFSKKYILKSAKVLDLCAAPGGKSTHLSAVLPEGSLLIANEVIRSRATILSENLIKWGNPHTIVTNDDPSDIGKLTGFFDVIVADLPCSGEGMFRKNPASIGEWSLQNVQLCAERQQRIVADIWPALKSGGILIYSTCTYNREENENNIDWICRELEAGKLEDPHRFMPHKTKGEGYFIAGIQKKSNACHGGTNKVRNRSNSATTDQSKFLAPLGIKNSADDFSIFSEKNMSIVIPSTHREDYLFLKNKLKIVSAGIVLGEMKGKDFIPNHALAMSDVLSTESFPIWELDKEMALNYLRKEAFRNIPSNLPKGYVLVSYKNHPLGFIKNIGTRANNLYPSEWRIRNL
jgi:16S rRNA C967 or C1407 C5-methylase (RsmB/RsmF family)/NOL1/NOP2/fmu family ribosome biogenesis protein